MRSGDLDHRIQATSSQNEGRFDAIARVSYPIGLAAHIGLLAAFALLGQTILAWFNVVSVIIFSVAIVLQRRNNAIAAYLLISAEITAHAILATLILGWQSGFSFYLFNGFSVLLVPFWTRRIRIMTTAVFMGLFTALAATTAFQEPANPVSGSWMLAFLLTNALTFAFVVSAIVLSYRDAVERTEAALEREHERSEALLRNVMPAEIAERLKGHTALIADHHGAVSILFADIVGFTDMAASRSPEQLIRILDALFTAFDQAVDVRGLEKIKTIGDAYMVVAGLPKPRPDHAEAIADLALDFMRETDRVGKEIDEPLTLRVGLHSGDVVAGVIGQKKFAYDLWGDAVNTSARMESHSEPGRIQVTASFRDLLVDRYQFEPGGVIDIKGKGPMEVFYLVGLQDRLGQDTEDKPTSTGRREIRS